MFKPFNLVTMVAVLAVFSFIATADSQRAPQAPKSANEQIVLTPGNGSDGSSGDGVGWNYVDATNCGMSDKYGNTYITLFPEEGGFFWTITPAYRNVIMSACQTGN